MLISPMFLHSILPGATLNNHVSPNCQTERELSLSQQSLGCLKTFPEAVTDKCQRAVAKLGKLLGSDH